MCLCKHKEWPRLLEAGPRKRGGLYCGYNKYGILFVVGTIVVGDISFSCSVRPKRPTQRGHFGVLWYRMRMSFLFTVLQAHRAIRFVEN